MKNFCSLKDTVKRNEMAEAFYCGEIFSNSYLTEDIFRIYKEFLTSTVRKQIIQIEEWLKRLEQTFPPNKTYEWQM